MFQVWYFFNICCFFQPPKSMDHNSTYLQSPLQKPSWLSFHPPVWASADPHCLDLPRPPRSHRLSAPQRPRPPRAPPAEPSAPPRSAAPRRRRRCRRGPAAARCGGCTARGRRRRPISVVVDFGGKQNLEVGSEKSNYIVCLKMSKKHPIFETKFVETWHAWKNGYGTPGILARKMVCGIVVRYGRHN